MQLLPGTNHGTNCLNTCYRQVLLHSGVDGVTSLAGNTPLVESRPDALGMGLTRNELKKRRRKWDTNPKQTYDSANSSFFSFLPSPSVLGWVCIIKGASPLAACWHQVVTNILIYTSSGSNIRLWHHLTLPNPRFSQLPHRNLRMESHSFKRMGRFSPWRCPCSLHFCPLALQPLPFKAQEPMLQWKGLKHHCRDGPELCSCQVNKV